MEKWFDINGYEGLYQISDDHIVRSLDRIVNVRCGKTRIVKGKILAPVVSMHEYFIFCFIKNGKRKNVKLHRIIAETFIPNPKNHPFVRHLNDCRQDNRLGNLAWGTSAENTRDAFENGKRKGFEGSANGMFGRTGVLSPRSKLIIDLQTGVFFYSLFEASVAKQIERNRLASMLNGKKINKTSLAYA